MPLNTFMFATGIENSYPTIRLPNGQTKRIDEMDKAGHYTHWEKDFQLVKDMGIQFLRYGPPYYATHTGPGQYDWDFADKTFARLNELGITPIVDLCHFGVPDWVGGFANNDWPEQFADYACAFAQRFPYLQFYTPVNEIYIAAQFSGLMGWWNDRLQSDRDFVRILHNLCRANVLAMRAIMGITPEATFIQSETTEFFHAEEPDCQATADFYNERRFLSLDLTYGHPVSVRMYQYLLDNGMTREQYNWFTQHQVKANCIMGNDYYETNEHLIKADGSIVPLGDVFGYYVITHQYFKRYNLPVMYTETNNTDPRSVDWLKKQWANFIQLKHDGVPLVGFTWYSLIDQVDWDTALREDNNRVNALGLYDIDRQIRPVGTVYRELITRWQPMFDADKFGMLMM